MMALKIGAFTDPGAYAADAERFREQLVTAGRGAAPGPVLLPGEIEARTRAERLRDGVPVSPAVLAGIFAITDPLGVPRPTPLPG
jgi:uncharacterized oxidoreductase